MKQLVIWYKPQSNTYYYRIVRGIYYESYDYKVGSINSFGHVIVLVVPVYDISLTNTSPKCSLKKRIYFRLYAFLKKKNLIKKGVV